MPDDHRFFLSRTETIAGRAPSSCYGPFSSLDAVLTTMQNNVPAGRWFVFGTDGTRKQYDVPKRTVVEVPPPAPSDVKSE